MDQTEKEPRACHLSKPSTCRRYLTTSMKLVRTLQPAESRMQISIGDCLKTSLEKHKLQVFSCGLSSVLFPKQRLKTVFAKNIATTHISPVMFLSVIS